MVLAQTSLGGNFDWVWAAVAGMVGALAFLAVVYTGLGAGMTRMDFIYILGTMMVPNASRTGVYIVGFVAHEMMGAVFGVVHALLLHAVGVGSVAEAAWWGLLFGTVHGVVILVVMPTMLARMHPLVRRDEMQPPGVAMTGFGGMTPIGSLMAHAVFGLVVGWIYAEAVLR